jgi:simple sugar transport system ATP-binding protein
VLGGLLSPDSGRVLSAGRIGHVHQHFALPPGLTSAECLTLEDARLRFVSPGLLAQEFREIGTEVGLDLGDPHAEAARLPVGVRQRLEFARARARHPDLLILDEPTAVLAPPEVGAFMESVRETASRGAAVVFITHRLGEVFGLCDRLSVVRRGKLVSTRPAAETSAAALAAEFLPSRPEPARASQPTGAEILRAGPPLDFAVREHEILGIAGVDGNGQEQIVATILGRRRDGPSVTLFGRDVSRAGFRKLGASVIPGDRRREGLVLDFTIEENLRLAEPIPDRDPAETRRKIESFGIAPPEPRAPVRSLSGGNQQKVVLARELSRRPRFLLAVSPTRGLDLASTRQTLRLVREAADGGAAALLMSSDLDEIRAACDSFFVIFRGQLAGPFSPDAPAEEVGRAMAGLS